MKKFEIRFIRKDCHPVFYMANTKEEAIALAIKEHNDNSQNYYRESEVAFVEETNKIKIEEVCEKFIHCNSNGSHVEINRIDRHLELFTDYGKLILQPDFQRAHVWTEDQQVKYLEFLLRGGRSGRDIYFNRPDWIDSSKDCPDTVLVDGLQRLTAIKKFNDNDLVVFGKYRKNDFEYINQGVVFFVNNLKTRKEVLQWYLQMNDGGTPHSKEEIDKVKEMLKNE